MMSFPLIATYDGMSYVHLSNVLFSHAFLSDWDWKAFRTPLFPLALRVAFMLGGEQPESALLVTTVFGLAGILLMGSTARRIAGGTTGAATLVLLVFYPTLAGYEHMLLSETGTFFFLALLVWSLVTLGQAKRRQPLWFACWTALILALGFYWRPTIVYLSPVVAVVYLLLLFVRDTNSRSYLELPKVLRREFRTVLPGILIVAAGPWLIAYPWFWLAARHAPSISQTMLAFGIYKQAIIPIDDPVLGSLKNQYENAVRQNSRDGRLSLDGIATGDAEKLSHDMADVIQRAGPMRVIRKYPLRYTEGVFRSMIFFLGVPGDRRVDDENGNFSHYVFTLWPPGATLDAVLGWERSLVQFTPPPYKPGLDGQILTALSSPYKWLVLIAAMVSIGWLVFGVIRPSPFVIALAAIPLALIFLHALTLFAEGRYALPVYPLFLVNLILVISSCFQNIFPKVTKVRTQKEEYSNTPIGNARNGFDGEA